jgi:hypothetical protein
MVIAFLFYLSILFTPRQKHGNEELEKKHRDALHHQMICVYIKTLLMVFERIRLIVELTQRTTFEVRYFFNI